MDAFIDKFIGVGICHAVPLPGMYNHGDCERTAGVVFDLWCGEYLGIRQRDTLPKPGDDDASATVASAALFCDSRLRVGERVGGSSLKVRAPGEETHSVC